ncbi:hypothetical protein VTJ83DRAFT_7404 [Remersonia thermophila]|uniref:Flo11 n=1 Tax=Remersonia thermophila TaxID=72144 RepID=A0ABR4D3E7_9PEZI
MASSLDSTSSRPSSAMAHPLQRMPSRSRTQSISSDRPSTIAASLMSPPLSVSPEPAFVAASAASQIVTNDHDSHAESWYDQHGLEPSSEPATVSSAALQLVNSFLDQLLFNFLCVSRSTALADLRPAVTEVLKPKLAKDAINQADEELREYLGGDDEDAPRASAGAPASPADWDLELAWKRTRLRCMVYSSLGDMEEEDEDYYMEQGHLAAGPDDRFSEAVSPAVAIFLTSILEFMGEQALIVAGQAAYHRMRLKYEKELKEGTRSPTGIADRIVIEDTDMERVALDRTLGRLWRSWKKKIRSPATVSMDRLARSFSRDSLRSVSGHLRSPSSAAEHAVPATVREPDVEAEQAPVDVQPPGPQQRQKQPQQQQQQHERQQRRQRKGQEGLSQREKEERQQGEVEEKASSHELVEEYLVAASIPLPLGPDDVAEILIPGLARFEDEEEEATNDESSSGRPKSLVLLSSGGAPPAEITHSDLGRKRSNSLPAIAYTVQTTSDVQPEVCVTVQAAPRIIEPESSTTVAADASAESKAPGPDSETAIDAGGDAAEDDDIRDDDEDEVSIEEPRIIRSSRVSILGRSSSAASSVDGRPTAINTNLPLHPPSIHSARLIEVTSPRSPAISQRSSFATESGRRSSSSLANSRTNTPPVPEEREPNHDKGAAGKLTVAPVARSTLSPRVSSMAGAEHPADKVYTASPLTPTSPAAMVAHAGTSAATSTTARVTSRPAQAAFNVPPIQELPATKARQEEAAKFEHNDAHEPSTPSRRTKSTILPATSSPASSASSSSSGVLYIESMPALPEGKEDGQQHQRDDQRPYTATAKPPAVPERSAGRQAVANTSALRQPAMVGQVSMERSRPRSPSQSSLSRPRESSIGRARQPVSGSPASSKLKVVRTSEDNAQVRIDVARNFEELIQSDQTIQYTLTPENMRDLDYQSSRSISNGSPIVSIKPRKSEEARQNVSRSRSSSMPRSDSRTPPGASAPKSSGSMVHSGPDLSQSSTGKPGGVVPRSIPSMASKARGGRGLQAKDARLERENLSDLADFLRSTGPAGGAPSMPAKLRNQTSVSAMSIDTGRVSTTSNPNRPRFQAREPIVEHKDDNSDLIDFIRQGPPGGPGNPRIPRSVAPFRTTMDSDQFSGVIGGRPVDAQLRDFEVRTSQASTNDATESSVPPSIQSSINSHSALLTKTKATSYDTMGHDDMPMPQRKQRRVRDPYAIDLSDEEFEDDDDLAPIRPPRRAQTHEESLIDFLNNYAPPSEPVVQPLNIAQTRNLLNNTNNKPKKKASAPSLMARLTRRDSSLSGSNRPESPQAPSESRSLSSRLGSSGGSAKGGHVPIQVNIPGGMDAYTPPVRTSSMAAAALISSGALGPSGPAMSTGRVPMKKFEPRDPVAIHSRGTSDLADFLKNSAPPPGAGPMMADRFAAGPGPGPVAGREATNGGLKMFGRKKKPSISS